MITSVPTVLAEFLLAIFTHCLAAIDAFAINGYGRLDIYSGYNGYNGYDEWRTVKCPRQLNCAGQYSMSPCCSRPPYPPPTQWTIYPTTRLPIDPCRQQSYCGPPQYIYNPCCMYPQTPPTYPPPYPTYPPTLPPTYPPMYPPTYPCCNYACPPSPPFCPYPPGATRRIFTGHQRSCYLHGHCPYDYSCCNSGCGPMVCTRMGGTNNTVVSSKVNITVILTSACSDSLNFLRNQLNPLTSYLSQYINIELLPYGKVNQTTGTCQFGDGDCQGNRHIACGARYLPDQQSVLSFSLCMMESPNRLKSNADIAELGIQCVSQYPYSHQQNMRICSIGTEGYDLFQKAGARQQQLIGYPHFVPTVLFDGVVVIDSEHNLVNFAPSLCETIGKSSPEGGAQCRQIVLRGYF